MNRRQLLAGSGVAVAVALSGCSLFQLTETEAEAVEAYEEVYETHERGLERFSNGFEQFAESELPAAQQQFEQAADAFEAARELWTTFSIEHITVLPADEDEEITQVFISANEAAQDDAGNCAKAVEAIREDDSRSEYDETTIERAESAYEDQEYVIVRPAFIENGLK